MIVIGGGVLGVTTAMLAAEAGRRTVLVELGAFGNGATGAWFRILHGGLRYLQKLDIKRLRTSSEETSWFLREFPQHTQHAPFLMPLYNEGLKRPNIFRAAFAANEVLTIDHKLSVPAAARIPAGRVLNAKDTIALFPGVRRSGLKGGALWTEVVAPDEGGLFNAMLARAEAAGVLAISGAEAHFLVTEGGACKGVEVRAEDDLRRGLRLRGATVIIAAGASGFSLAKRFDPLAPRGTNPALGFNLLIDRPPLSQTRLSLVSEDGGSTLFFQPQGTQTFAGTWYEPWFDPDAPIVASEASIQAFLQAIADVAPALGATRADVRLASAGLLPTTAAGGVELAERDILHDHGVNGGPAGLFTAIGVKFTTARSLGTRALKASGLISAVSVLE